MIPVSLNSHCPITKYERLPISIRHYILPGASYHYFWEPFYVLFYYLIQNCNVALDSHSQGFAVQAMQDPHQFTWASLPNSVQFVHT